MCGIAGVFHYSREDAPDRALVERMTRVVAHRGPDDEGVIMLGPCGIGNRRLSIIDLATGHMPMASEDESVWITFNGEIYNYRELRQTLGVERFRTKSDTEVILQLAAGAESPARWVRKLDGMFAFALAQGPELVMARDPLGIKPLYVGVRGGRLIFASELKALQKCAQDIREFPAGHVYTSTGGLQRYYRLPDPSAQAANAETACRDILERLEAAVRKRLVADVPLGVFLSGGLDSSLIAALAAKHKQPLDTFYVGTADSPDRAPARLMADFLKTRHHERDFTIEEALAALPEVIYHLESFDCALVRSAIPNFFLAKLASEHVKVALSGEGADELFAGYEYLKSLDHGALAGELQYITDALHNTNLQRCDRMSMAHGLEVRVPFLDVTVVDCASRIPTALKQWGPARHEKWILRKAAEGVLPPAIAWRGKVKFATGAGLGATLAEHAEREIADAEFTRGCEIADGMFLRSKEEMLYHRFFKRAFPGDDFLPLIGRSRSV